MKASRAATAIMLTATVGCRAATVETAIIAAMDLSEQPNYSWTTSVTDDAQTYEIEGKTVNGGYTWQRQPMPKVVARRLGRAAGRELESIFNGPARYVIRTENTWKMLEELPRRHPDWSEGDDWYYVSTPAMRGPEFPADESEIDAFGLPSAIYIPVMRDEANEDRPYSNAQFALALPHEQLTVIVSSHCEFEVDGNVAAGTLTDLGAQLLLVYDGHEYIKPVVATGRFKLWMNDGMVGKYVVELAGIVVVERKAVYVRQKSMTDVKNVGTTAFAVPEDARRRLDD